MLHESGASHDLVTLVQVPRLPIPEDAGGRFCPKPPVTLEEAGIPGVLAEALIFKALLAAGSLSGRDVARATALPGKPTIEILASFKAHQLVEYKDNAAAADFQYALTEAGRRRARDFMAECSYVGPAPVTLEAYCVSVAAQGMSEVHPRQSDLERAFADLVIDIRMLERLGPAINSGRGLFLYGFPGNGKTSIAERITDCFGDSVWVPYAISCGGQLITLYDPQTHQRIDPSLTPKGGSYDPRWILVRRPTIVTGGELTLAALDLCHNEHTNITEPSLQLKSNTGTLVIDDFGRQRMRPIELLNRWIVPLEKRYDFLTLANGKKIKVPFNQLIIFSTNLEPKDLVDEAFLRRIPYKINVGDPTEDQFRDLCERMAPLVGVGLPEGAVDHLVEKHYRDAHRPFRSCQPRDLLLQVLNNATYHGEDAVATPEALDRACENYFTVM